MALYKKNLISIYHVHIPRTGGRYIKQVLLENDYNIFHDDYNESIYGISLMHLHYPLYEILEDVKESKHLVIVRNPFDRFCSATHCIVKSLYPEHELDIYSQLETKDGLYNFIEYHAMTKRYNSNWLRPQNEFLSNNSIIYNFENGLTKNFIDWFNKTFFDNLKNKQYDYYGDPNELEENILKGNKKIENLIKQYYSKDYEILGY
jgi:hypothetical protein